MNYKVKAHDLVDQYFIALSHALNAKEYSTRRQKIEVCKVCALLAINEIIDTLQPGEDDLLADLIAYWQNVKKEIQKV